FSSRRRHTRCYRDWSSDVCSSDLTRTYDDSAMFEALTLGVFEVGLSWSIVFGKRDAFRKAFRNFDVAKVAAMRDRDVDRLVQDRSAERRVGKGCRETR